MYSLLKKYKNLENHKIIGKITKIERLVERSILLEFLPKSLELSEQYNYCPVVQQYFGLKTFLAEDLFADKEFFELNAEGQEEQVDVMENPYVMINEVIPLELYNSDIILEKALYKKYLNNLFIKAQFKLYKKFFNRLEKLYRYNFLKKIKKLYFNRNILKFIYIFKFGKVKAQIFIKQFIRTIFLLVLLKNLKKKKPLPTIFKSCNNGGLLFLIPGLYEKIFTPFGFLHMKKKYSLEHLQLELNKKKTLMFSLNLHSIQKISHNKIKFIAKFKKIKFLKKKRKKI